MAVQDAAPRNVSDGFAALNDQRVRGVIFQVLLVIGIVSFAWWLVGNTAANLRAQGLPFGFNVLRDTAGFGVNQSLISYSETSSYGRVYFVGLLNTLLIAGVGIAFATIIGFIVGIARLSRNWVVAKIAYVYIEVLRNIPLLLQIFIWYFGVLQLLPQKREALNLGPLGMLNIAGYYAPKPVFGEGSGLIGFAFLLGLAGFFVVRAWARKRQMETGEQFPLGVTGVGLIAGLPILAYIIAAIGYDGAAISFAYPELQRFGPRGGLRVLPEFIGLLLALSFYTASFIAEIVRAGILAVSHGQTEASYSLGLRPGPTLRLVIIPQAMRVIIPPLTSQYLNLTKNSSLAVAIAYPDLVSVFAGTALNQTGRAVELILITMGTYLLISLITSLFMNWYNRSVALVER